MRSVSAAPTLLFSGTSSTFPSSITTLATAFNLIVVFGVYRNNFNNLEYFKSRTNTRTILLAPYRKISTDVLKSIRDDNYLVGRRLQNRNRAAQNENEVCTLVPSIPYTVSVIRIDSVICNIHFYPCCIFLLMTFSNFDYTSHLCHVMSQFI